MKTTILGLLGPLSLAFAAPTDLRFDATSYLCKDVLVRDVIVVGGGASGTYGAIALKDLGKSVAVIEKKDVFGGHTHTFAGPNGTPIDYGVRQYNENDVARAFFKRFNVEMLPLAFGGFTFVDFSTGETIANFQESFNFTGYTAQINKYPDLSQGLWQLPQPFPADLLLPFGQFVEKYRLQSIVYTIGNLIWGAGTLLTRSTAFVFQQFSRVYVDEISSGASGFRTANNSAIYFKARAELGDSALVSSTILGALRTSRGVAMVVQTPTGKKLLLGSQVLFSAPLLLENTAALGLDKREYDVFKEFRGAAYYVMLLEGTGLNNSLEYNNVGTNTPYNIPILPASYQMVGTPVPDWSIAIYGGDEILSEDQVKAQVIGDIRRISGKTAEVVRFANHTPAEQFVSNEALKRGVYHDLHALQGYRNTWYTGNALALAGTTGLWNFTQGLVPGIAAAAKSPSGAFAGFCRKS